MELFSSAGSSSVFASWSQDKLHEVLKALLLRQIAVVCVRLHTTQGLGYLFGVLHTTFTMGVTEMWVKEGVSPTQTDCRRLFNSLSGSQLISSWAGKHSLYLL